MKLLPFPSQVNLNRLSNRESLAMVTHLLDTEHLESSLEEFILEKTEGIPFFRLPRDTLL